MPSTPVREPRSRRAAAARIAVAALAATLFAAAPWTFGQPVLRNDENLDLDRPEAWALAYFTSVSLLPGFGVPEERRPGSLEIGVELSAIPHLDGEQRRVGFSGSKAEDVNKAPLLLRPRAVVGLPRGFTLTVAYVPPVEVFDVEPHLLAVALERPVADAGDWRFGARLFAQVGRVRSDITCPDEVVGSDDPEVNPTGCDEPSSDTVHMRYAGVELSAGRAREGSSWRPYGALAVQRLDTEFEVDALTRGLRDRSRLTARGWTWSATAGVGWRSPSGLGVAVEAFYTPLSVERTAGEVEDDPLLTLRSLASWSLP